MNKKTILTAVLLLLVPVLAAASPVTKDEARSKALSFVASRAKAGLRKAPVRDAQTGLAYAGGSSSYHVFNVAGGGFVMLSGSDLTPSVIGYSDSGTFSPDHVPEAFRSWLSRWTRAVEAAEQGTRRRASAPRRSFHAPTAAKNAVPVLVGSRWNQGDPYNAQCPTYDDGGTQKLSATGCVATAMAQIMYFWKWPKEATPSIPGYTTNWNNTTVTYPEMPPVRFDWDAMTDTYTGESSETARRAVAELMRYVGHSVCMGYGAASGAASVNTVKALKSYYGYDKNMFYASSDDYDYQSWEDLIYTELAAGRPVLMNGDTSDRTGGHEWVCDGYDGNGLFHMNWGWGGMCDGWFILTVMFPDQQGIGGSTSSDGYSMGQGIVVGLKPAPGPQPDPEEMPRISMFDIRLDKTEYSRRSESGNFFFPISYAAGTNMSRGYRFDAAFTLYDADGNILKETVGTEQNFEIQPGTYWPTRTMTVAFGAGLKDGTYYLRGRSREHGTSEWHDSDKASRNYVRADISGGTRLLLTVCPSVGLTVNALDLIGSGGVGSEYKVRANITNNERTEYYRDTYLIVDGQWVSGNCIVVPAGRTADYYFKFKPASEGEHTFALSTSKETKDAFFTVKKTVETAATPTLGISMKALSTPYGSDIYGDCMRLEVRVRNNGSSAYRSYIEASPWKLDGSYYWKKSSARQDIDLAAGRDTTLVYVFEGLDIGGRYNFHADSNGGGSANLGDFTFRTGIIGWTADGVGQGAPNASGFKITPDLAAVSFPGAKPVAFSIEGTPNPNLIVYFEDGATVGQRVINALRGKGVVNIVFGTKADVFALTDGHDLYVPYGFTASKASYSRQLDDEAAQGGWSTLALPFAPQVVADGTGRQLGLASSGDEAGRLVVREFVAADGDHVTFADTERMEACRPYMVSVGSKTAAAADGGENPTLVFSADNADVMPTQLISTYTTDYKFVGTTSDLAPSRRYVLSGDGSAFVADDRAVSAPFRAFFEANNDVASAVGKLIVDSRTPTSLEAVKADSAAPSDGTPVYDLSGRRVGTYTRQHGVDRLPKGLYVVAGRKYAVE